jgi:hypothetical protein
LATGPLLLPSPHLLLPSPRLDLAIVPLLRGSRRGGGVDLAVGLPGTGADDAVALKRRACVRVREWVWISTRVQQLPAHDSRRRAAQIKQSR